jgi:hypothetical protein
MTNSWMVYAQDLSKNKQDSTKPQIDLMLVNGDTMFVINRKFAEQIAIQYDSLEITSNKLNQCNDVVNDCVKLKDQYKVALEKSEDVTIMLKKELTTKDKVIKSYEKIDESQQKIVTELNNEFRKAKNRNKWLTGLTIAGISVGFTSTILLLLK